MNSQAPAAPTMPEATRSNRLIALDAFRFFAALCVVVYHYNLNFELHLDRWSPAFHHFYVMVDFFFILSGFVIALSYSDRLSTFSQWRAYIVSRLARIYPLHLATLLFLVLFAVAGAVFNLRSNDPAQWSFAKLPAQLLLVHAWGVENRLYFNAPSWSISAEWFVYLTAPFLFRLVDRVSLGVGLGIACAAVVAFIAFRNALGLTEPWTNATYDFGALRALPEFFAGAVLARAYRERATRFDVGWPAVYALALAVLVALHFGMPDELAVVLFCALIAIAAAAEQGRPGSMLTGRVARRLGDASYAIYMLHMPMIIVAAYFMRRVGLLGTPAALAAALVSIAATLALALVTHDYFEAPMRGFIRGWTARAAIPSSGSADRSAD